MQNYKFFGTCYFIFSLCVSFKFTIYADREESFRSFYKNGAISVLHM